MATPRTLEGVTDVGSLATWKSALRIPHRQRMPRETRLRVRESCEGGGLVGLGLVGRGRTEEDGRTLHTFDRSSYIQRL